MKQLVFNARQGYSTRRSTLKLVSFADAASCSGARGSGYGLAIVDSARLGKIAGLQDKALPRSGIDPDPRALLALQSLVRAELTELSRSVMSSSSRSSATLTRIVR